MDRSFSINTCFIASLLIFLSSLPAYSFCFEEAGQMYGIAPEILEAIAQVESNYRHDAVNLSNQNGSYDFGLMQINSSWHDKIGRDLWMELGDPCINVKVGAWILAQCIRQHGYTWKGIGCYNARSEDKQRIYISKIQKAIKEHKSPPESKSDQ
jgi:soluble lytic murein transglycosylase-like protein